MKKGLLLFSGLFLALFSSKVNAQDFDYNMNPKSATTIGDEITKKAANNKNGIKEGVLQNSINFYMPSSAANQMVPKDDAADANGTNHGYIRMNGNAKYFLIMESVNGIKQVSVQIGGGTTPISSGTEGAMEVKYGVLPPDTVGLNDPDLASVYMSVWESSLKTLNTTMPGYGGGMAPPPGNISNFVVNNATDPFADDPNATVPTRYVRLTSKASGTTTKLFRVAASTTSFILLPLNLLSFTAKADAWGKSVNLNWQTTNEVNTKEFIIERRTDNTDFKAIDIKASNNVAGIHNYSYTDNNPLSGNLYYRLKQVDGDGQYKYSDVVQANVEARIALSVYPNPTDRELNVSHEAAINNAFIRVLDINGKSLIHQSVSKNESFTNLDLSRLATGNYILIYTNDNKHAAVKFVKH